MKLVTKLSLLTATLLFFLCVFGVFSLYQMDRINSASTEISKNWMPSTNAVNMINTALSDFRIYEVMHVFSSDREDMQQYEKSIQEMNATLEKLMQQYSRLISEDDEQRIFDKFCEEYKRYMRIHEQIFVLSKQNREEEALVLLRGASRESYIEATKFLVELVNMNTAHGEEASNHGDELYAQSRVFLSTLLGMGIVAGIVLSFVIIRSIFQQLGKDPGALNIIARRVVEGDYDVDDGSSKVGVYGSIIEMINTIKQHIENVQHESQVAREQTLKAQEAMQQADAAAAEAQAKTRTLLMVAGRLEEVGDVVSSASTQLAAQIEQAVHGASEATRHLSDAASAMNEMNATVHEVAHNAETASSASSETRKSAIYGAQIVEKSLRSIEEVHQLTVALKDDMTLFNEHTQNISHIMAVISDIADQTNLLALNAAIEAARAGDAGRGFAVVADEVRKLAEKTMSSTEDVGNAIKAIQDSATQTMHGMEKALHRVGEATELSSQSGAALQQIVTTVEGTADQVKAIATASEEQSVASEEINKAIGQVNEMATQTVTAMEQSASAVTDLANQAHNLADLIQELKKA